MEKTKKITLLSNFLAIAIVLNIIEASIPIIPVPGAKLGFANIMTLIIIYIYSFKEGIAISILRVVLVSLLSGRFLGPTFYMSMSGVLLSTIMMGIFVKLDFFGPLGVSAIGSIFHCIGQIAAGIFVIGSVVVLAYLPIMLFLSVPTGILTGIIAKKFLSIWRTVY
ncbi:MAG: Gx transporter family protein [Acholeplasmataceae bacterium]